MDVGIEVCVEGRVLVCFVGVFLGLFLLGFVCVCFREYFFFVCFFFFLGGGGIFFFF